MSHVMLDIETLGVDSDAVILSIGAIKFDPRGGELEPFYVRIDAQSCTDYGLKMNAATVMWWMHPDRAEARGRLIEEEALDLGSALEGFNMWFGNTSMPVWGNGSTFDNVILRTAYKKAGLTCPWSFRHDRCYRTLVSLAPDMAIEKKEAAHHALDDAAAQAYRLQEIVAHFGLAI